MSDWARRLSCSVVGGGGSQGGLGGGDTSVGGVEAMEGDELIVEAVEISRCAGGGCNCCETLDVSCSIRDLSCMRDSRVEDGPIRSRSQVTQRSWASCPVSGVRSRGNLQDGQGLSVRT
jgi:hypothetical protein